MRMCHQMGEEGLRDGISVGPLLPEGKLMGVLSQLELCRRVSSMLTWPLTWTLRVHAQLGHLPWRGNARHRVARLAALAAMRLDSCGDMAGG